MTQIQTRQSPAAARTRKRLAQLRDRFIAVSLRSRSLRLRRTSRTGAFDLSRLSSNPSTLEKICQALGHEESPPILLAAKNSALESELGQLARAARQDYMESGADNLAVGWPIIEGACADGTWLRAPLLLYPVRLEQTTTGRLGWALNPRDLPEVNEPLIQAFARLEGVRLTREDLLAFDEDAILTVDDPTWKGLIAYLKDVGLHIEADPTLPKLSPLPTHDTEISDQACAGRFQLRHHLVLGRFPLSASNIVMDYDALLNTPDAQLLNDRLGLAQDLLHIDESTVEQAPEREDKDEFSTSNDATTFTPSNDPLGSLRRWQVLASDDSQDAVFRYLESAQNRPDTERGVVVQGPPGTGKSQLIANLLAACVGRGERVLLVCQKRAALDVVVDRLSSLGMREPIALVHDVQRDRNAICTDIAATLDRALSGTDLDAAGLEQKLDLAAEEHNQALDALASRASAAQQAYRRLTGAHEPRPGLAELLERALDDDLRPLPNLAPFAHQITQRALAAHTPFVESIAHETHRLASPHPLAQRGDWAPLEAAEIDSLFERFDQLDRHLAELDRPNAQMSPGLAQEHAELWKRTASLLDLLSTEQPDQTDAEIDNFALFWVWTGGQVATGDWSRVMHTLEVARAQLSWVPYELVMASHKTLKTWKTQLARLADLRLRWWRFALPEFWRLRKTPAQILEHCSSLASRPESERNLPVDVSALIEHALEWNDLLAELPTDNPLFEFGFDGNSAGIEDAINSLNTQHQRVECAHQLHRALQGTSPVYATLPQLDSLLDHGPQTSPFFAAALSDRHRAKTLSEIDTLLEEFGNALGEDFRDQLLTLAKAGEVEAARAKLSAFRDARGDAEEAARQDRAMSDQPAWVRDFLLAWTPDKRGITAVREDLRCAVERAWTVDWLDGQSIRTLESPLVAPEQREQLARSLQRCQEVAGRGIVGQFYSQLLDTFGASTNAKGPQKRRTMRKMAADLRQKRNRKTLRQLIDTYWEHGLATVRPAWCCSPESVAAMFPLRAGLFDVVIFDEASQCPVESALPALLRAKTAVIAGDDQQMPPSHFFRASPDIAEDEEGSLLASVSILALARACYPGVTLRWHYRSHHEELVALSNAAFYAGRLITAPSSRPLISADIEGLHWDPVDGIWQDNHNTVEAQRVVDHIKRFLTLTKPDGHPPTVGVVTFNQKQSEYIEYLLEKRTTQDPEFARLLERDRSRALVDQLFVRNLENVQGNERDLIILSPGYGPTERSGPVHARFGPLNLAGGHKRLNVAITRARLGLWLVTSIIPERLDVSNSTHPGPRIFDAYLRFVRAHATNNLNSALDILERVRAMGLGSAGAANTPSHFGLHPATTGTRTRDELADALSARGFEVRRDVGLGSQRLDLAVRQNPEHPWRIGIDCRHFLTQPETLSRDVYRPAFWTRQGWSITRVSPGMWRERRDEVLSDLIANVKAPL